MIASPHLLFFVDLVLSREGMVEVNSFVTPLQG